MSFSGEQISSINSTGSVIIRQKEVTARDVQSALNMSSTLKVNTINEGEFSVCSTKVFAFNQHHGKEFTYGYKVEKFAYSTDVKSFPKSSEKYLYDLDLWVIDCVRHEPHYSHSHFDQTIQWIKKFKPKKAILTHLGAWLDYDELKKLCPNNVEPGYDGLTQYLT